MPEHYDLLMPAGLASGDQYGAAMCANGEWLFIGAPGDDQAGSNVGAVYVFRLKGAMWTFQQKLLPTGGNGAALFGSSIAADGDWLIIGAPVDSTACAAFAFMYNGTQWVQTQKLLPFGPGNVFQQFGWAVAMQGDLAVVGARQVFSDEIYQYGAAFVFQRDGTTWTAQQQLISNTPGFLELFGTSIAIAEQTIVVGSANDDTAGADAGAVFAFTFDGKQWTQQSKFTGNAAGDLFGTCIVADDDRLMIGSPHSDIAANDAGAVYPYRFEAGQWISDGDPIVANDALASDEAGTKIALRDDSLLIAAPSQSGLGQFSQTETQRGAVYVFRLIGGGWVEDRQLHLAQPVLSSYSKFGPYSCWSYGEEPHYWPLSLTIARLGTAIAISNGQFLASTPQIVRPYCWSYDGPDYSGSVNIFQPTFQPPDCNANGIQDGCDPEVDCNNNFIPDSCDLALEASHDCNINAVPDECEQGFQYQLDTEMQASAWYFGAPSTHSDLIWLNQYRVKSGGQVITHVSLVRTIALPIGAPVEVMIYSDPNQDGNPVDAQLLAVAQTTSLSSVDSAYRFVDVPIAPTFVGNPGEFFFVGAYLKAPLVTMSNFHWTAMVSQYSGITQRSWVAHAPYGQGDIEHLAKNASPIQPWPYGPFLLRAIAADCNNNGIWDACDIQNGTLPDVNGNGIPDGCEAPACLFADVAPQRGDGMVDVADLLAVINHWGACTPCYAICPGDTNEDCAINVTDLLAVIGSWGPCPH